MAELIVEWVPGVGNAEGLSGGTDTFEAIEWDWTPSLLSFVTTFADQQFQRVQQCIPLVHVRRFQIKGEA